MADQTPNIRLQEIDAGRKNWSDIMNKNLVLIDAVVGAYFSVQNLQGVWQNSTMYTVGQTVVDQASSVVYSVLVDHTSSNVPTTFAQDRATNPSYWGVYSSPARSRGVWMTNTAYALNDFVVSGSQYAICIAAHTSGATFAADLALSRWSILVDLSSVGTAVLPVPGGAGDANKFTVMNSLGTGYTIVAAAQALTLLGISSIGAAVFAAASSSDALAAIGAQPAGSYQAAGSYQPLAASLTSLASATIGAYGLTVLAMAAVSDLKTSLGLGTAAYLAVGVNPNQVVQLDGTSKLPAVDGSALLNVGTILQTVTYETGAYAAGTTAIPYDDTIPQITEGDEYMTLAITPKSATSKLIIEVVFNVAESSGATVVTAALFRDATANALACAASLFSATNVLTQVCFLHEVVSGSVVATTFRLRAGPEAGTINFNGKSGARMFGGVLASSIKITERAA